jgi:protein SCO1/2
MAMIKLFRYAVLAVAFLIIMAWSALAHDSRHNERLPVIGPAPEFALTSQDGETVTLADYKGKVVAVTFIFTSCADTCPLLTDKMARVQDALGELFGRSVAFVSITVDPERDTPQVLKDYAAAYDANLSGWTFLTGTPDAIRDVERAYGVYAAKTPNGDVDHTFLTSIIDRHGNLRVQYLGVRFDAGEFRRDLVGLLEEPQ